MMNHLLTRCACFVLLADALCAQAAPEPWRDWNNLSQLRHGQEIQVETVQPVRKRSGRFVARDDAGITIDLGGGRSETLSKDDVRKVVLPLNIVKATVLYGAIAGGVVMAVLVGRKGTDLSSSGKAAFVGAGGGLGALGGWGIGSLAKYKMIYEAPKR
jgi:hypothetical protein